MTTSSGNLFTYSSSMAQNNGAVPNQSASRMALDNLIRRELKVSDPNDASQVAQALLTRYKDNPRATAITREAEGVPFLLSASPPPAMMQAQTSSDAEVQQAMNDVEQDFQELTTNAILKDIKLELQGWQVALRSAITEGINAARFALDPRQRDKTFGVRRTLGNYARIARLVGALTPSLTVNYRKLAQSLDEVASVLLVMMGEALANVSFNGSRYLLQAPYSELQTRRDAAIYALRNLVGATQEAYAPNEWPRGIDAYRKLFDYLESHGQGELRALLVENELVRIMDSLIHRADHGRAEGLRALGATAQLDVERLRRLVVVGRRAVNPSSPPLTAFLETLQLFVDGFEGSGGFRLLRVARPPILFYGLYGISGLDPSERKLLELSILRNRLAEQLDCFAQCGCDPTTVKCQIVLDKILYDLDRAIDLYAVGTKPFGEPEQRAAAYSYIVAFLLNLQNSPLSPKGRNFPACNYAIPLAGESLQTTLITILQRLDWDLVISSTTITVVSHPLTRVLPPLSRALEVPYIQELFIQKDMEAGWQNLVQSMAPSCIAFSNRTLSNNPDTGDGIFDVIEQVIDASLLALLPSDTKVEGLAELNPDIPLPRHYEESLRNL
jgi:hypothetical protein